MPKELFGTDGIRGVPGTAPLDDATLFATGRSLASYLLRGHSSARALIGMDTRQSGPHIAALLAAGLQQGGASVAFAGVITTPGVACLVRRNDFQAGVVISASHNPYHDNGVKFFSHEGMKFRTPSKKSWKPTFSSTAPPQRPRLLRYPSPTNPSTLNISIFSAAASSLEPSSPASALSSTAPMVPLTDLVLRYSVPSARTSSPSAPRPMAAISTTAADRCILKASRNASLPNAPASAWLSMVTPTALFSSASRERSSTATAFFSPPRAISNRKES